VDELDDTFEPFQEARDRGPALESSKKVIEFIFFASHFDLLPSGQPFGFAPGFQIALTILVMSFGASIHSATPSACLLTNLYQRLLFHPVVPDQAD